MLRCFYLNLGNIVGLIYVQKVVRELRMDDRSKC